MARRCLGRRLLFTVAAGLCPRDLLPEVQRHLEGCGRGLGDTVEEARAGHRWAVTALPFVAALFAVGLVLGFTLPSEAGPGPSPSPASAAEPVAATTAKPPAVPQVTHAEAPLVAQAVSAAEPAVQSPCPPVRRRGLRPQFASAAPRRTPVVERYDTDDATVMVEGRLIRASI